MPTLTLRPLCTLPSSDQALCTSSLRETVSRSIALFSVKSSRITVAIPLCFLRDLITAYLVSPETNLQITGRLPSYLKGPSRCAVSIYLAVMDKFSLLMMMLTTVSIDVCEVVFLSILLTPYNLILLRQVYCSISFNSMSCLFKYSPSV